MGPHACGRAIYQQGGCLEFFGESRAGELAVYDWRWTRGPEGGGKRFGLFAPARENDDFTTYPGQRPGNRPRSPARAEQYGFCARGNVTCLLQSGGEAGWVGVESDERASLDAHRVARAGGLHGIAALMKIRKDALLVGHGYVPAHEPLFQAVHDAPREVF